MFFSSYHAFTRMNRPFPALAKAGIITYTELIVKPSAFSNSFQGEPLFEKQLFGACRLTGRFAAAAQTSQNRHSSDFRRDIMKDNLIIRIETTADYAAVENLTREAF